MDMSANRRSGRGNKKSNPLKKQMVFFNELDCARKLKYRVPHDGKFETHKKPILGLAAKDLLEMQIFCASGLYFLKLKGITCPI
jgi:hypothetical protein